MSVLARHVLCILHDDLDRVSQVVEAFPGFSLDREYSQASPDDRMRSAFEASMDRVDPSFEQADWDAIDGHLAVAYVLSPPMEPERARDISADALRLVAASLATGGRAAKAESAGIAHGAARWRALAVELDLPDRRDFALHAAFVRRPIADDDSLYTCGMHLLGRADIEIGNEVPIPDALRWLDVLALYSLIEVSPDQIEDGHTFRTNPRDRRRPIRHLACGRYESDDFFFNPLGYLRLGDPIAKSKTATSKSKAKSKSKTGTSKSKAKSKSKTASKPKAKLKSKTASKAKAKSKSKTATSRPKPKPKSKAKRSRS